MITFNRNPAFAGKKILITRPEEKSSTLAEKLKALGARPIVFPLTRIVSSKTFHSIDESLKKWNEFDIVVFTSALAVKFYLERAQTLKIRLLNPKILYAIGPQTAKALKAAGFGKIRMAREFRAEGLLEELRNVRGLKILIPRAAAAREILPRTLRKRGATVRVPTVYQVLPNKKSLEKIQRMSKNDFDAVIFTSGRSVKEFVKAFGLMKSRKLFSEVPGVCIGGVTAEVMAAYGINGVKSQSPDEGGLIKALKKVLRKGDTGENFKK